MNKPRKKRTGILRRSELSIKKILIREIEILDAKTSTIELLKESLINFSWGFFGNSIVLFMSKEIDIAVFLNFLLYYLLISFIVNRAKYETVFGRVIFLPLSASFGAFTGYKFAQYISQLF